MGHELPELGYGFDAVEPHIDSSTMEIHHDRHHATYVANLNAVVEGNGELEGVSVDDLVSNLETLPDSVRTAVRNNGGGHYNHSLFWTIIAPGGSGYEANASSALKSAIGESFGGYDEFAAQIAAAAAGQFGSGWAWLTRGEGGALKVEATANQDNPLMTGSGTPILGVDVWEHAYYLRYQNKRPDYVQAWLQAVNWTEVSRRFAQ